MAYIKINTSHFAHNLQLLSEKLGSVDRLAVVLKDNAYGHGLDIMAKLASGFGVKRAVVRTVSEAKIIQAYFTHIIILSEIPKEKLEDKFSVAINDLEALNKAPHGSKIDLKIDSGMHRNGIMTSALERAFAMIKQKDLQLVSVMTHFRSADELSSELFWQMQNWKAIKKRVLSLILKYELPKPLFHSANSAATLRLNHYEDDFARCGIAIYGYHEMPECFGVYDLKPVLSLWAEKISSRQLKKGDRVGYGGMFAASKEMTVSTYDIGYGDGFFRFNGKGKLKTAEGKQILGRVSMDNISIEGAAQEVCLFNNAKLLSKQFDTISYDVLVKLKNIPHILSK